jgi:hypothetical protein
VFLCCLEEQICTSSRARHYLSGIKMQGAVSTAMKIPCCLSVILLFPLGPLVNAYTWQFSSPPRQCEDVTISIQGSGGQPPYSLMILPIGPSPLPNNVEVRTIMKKPFSGTSTTLSFSLNYPENSSFVAVVRSYLSRHIFSVISSYRPILLAGQRQERFWYRWCQHFDHRSRIVQLELLQSI